jgi:hypothetical protein
MPKIVDPDQLNQATEVVISPANKTIQLLVAGNLDDNSPGKSSGVTHQALYSFLKEEWRTDANLRKLRFPLLPIFEAKFDWVNGWQPADQQSRDLIRDGGFRLAVDDSENGCIISLGDTDAPLVDQAYYQQIAGFDQTTSTFDKTGELNENIQIWDGGANDYRDFLKVYLREQGKLYAEGNLLVDQDLATLTYQAYRIPLENSTDLNVSESDVNIDANTPYTGMSISYLLGTGFTSWTISTVYPAESVVQDSGGRWWFTLAGGTSGGDDSNLGGGSDTGVTWESYVGERQIGTSYYAFNRIIAGNGGTRFQIYEWAQRQLRKTGDINADALGSPNQDGFGTVNGNVAALLSFFRGSTLVTEPGVYIDNFDANDTNDIAMSDITVDGGGLDSESVPLTSNERTFPFVAAGTISFSDNLVAEPDADTRYGMYFQYTTRDTGTDIAVTSASGATATLTSSTTDFTTNFSNGDYLAISGFTNAVNNGLYQVNGVPTANSMAVRKLIGTDVLIDESSGATVNLDNDPYDTPDAILVNDDSGPSPIEGQITGASVSFDFDYDNNNQGGRTPGTDAPVAIFAIGKDVGGGQWQVGLFTITRTTGLSFPINAADERVYSNPV